MRSKKTNLNVITIFDEVQRNEVSLKHQIIKLKKLFEHIDADEFLSSFLICLKQILASSGDFSSSADKCLKFAVDFTIHILEINSSENEVLNSSPQAEKFFFQLFNFFHEKHNVADSNARRRICQFISKFIVGMSTEAELDLKICDTIIYIMRDRIKDKIPTVRIQAILAIYRLQDVSDTNCPVIKILLNCIETDTSADVRKTALSKITFKQKHILRRLLDRVDDISGKVRQEFYQTASKLHPQYFNTEQRKRLLYTGLYDNNEMVRKVVKCNLLPLWLKRLDNDILKFLHLFDMIVISPDFITKILMSIFEKVASDHTRKTLDILLDDLHLIPHDKLSCETAFYWRCYVFYASGLVEEKKNYEWNSEKSYDAAAEGLLPDLSVFCEYIKTYYDAIDSENDVEIWNRKEQEFIFIQLIELCKVYDYADEVGRKSLMNLCLKLLNKVQNHTIRPVIELYFMLRTNLDDSVRNVTEAINNILHPIGIQIENEKKDENCPISEHTVMSTNEEKACRFKIAKQEVRLEELKDELEEAVRKGDSETTRRCNNEFDIIRKNISQLKSKLYQTATSMIAQESFVVDPSLKNSDENDDDDNKCNTNPLAKLSDEIILRCVTIMFEMMQLSFIKYIIPEVRTLFQDFVSNACQSNNSTISALATELMGSICLRDKKLAAEYFITFFSLFGNSDICVSALKVMFDLLICFGPSTFNISNLDDVTDGENEKHDDSDIDNDDTPIESDDDRTIEEKGRKNEISGYTLVSVLIDLLDDEYEVARYTVVHGLCRLMAVGKLKSAKVLSRLIIVWFHPASNDLTDIRDCLNFFFPYFIKRCPWALVIFEEAFIITLKTLFDAPKQNPISEIDQKVVIKVLCDITNPNFVFDENEQHDSIHGNLAILICKTIMQTYEQEHIAVLLRGLEYLDLSGVHQSLLHTLQNYMNKIIRKFKKNVWRKRIIEVDKLNSKIEFFITQKENEVIPALAIEENEQENIQFD